MYIEHKAKTKKAGFSLIELLVSMSIFTMVMTMAVGALLVVIDANAKAQNMQEVMTNLTFALDSMTREIRTGRGYYCPDPPSNEVLNLENDDNVHDCDEGVFLSIIEEGGSLTGTGNPRIAYRYNSVSKNIERRIGDGDESWDSLTSDTVVITDMYFVVRNSDIGDSKQPNVTIYIEGEAGDLPGVDTSFAVQTTVTKRLLDLI